ncbi:MAG TPA: hypothetical protein VNB24_03980 [Acidimicrobiales bacterium]|nr:hypothetical protein [Acidimicrobiales bacterium]
MCVAAVLSAACSNGDKSPAGDIGIETSPGETTTTRARVDEGPGRPPAAGSSTPTDRAGRPTPTSPARPAPTSPSRTSPDPIVARANDDPGEFAGILLQAQPAAQLVLDVMRQPGAEPSGGSVARLLDVLETASGKPVKLTERVVPIAGEVHSADKIRADSDRHAAAAHGQGTAVVRALFLVGRYSEGASALGVAVRGDTFAVFPDQIRRAASPLASRSLVEAAVITHEAGHLLGLVDLYIDRNREDPEHPGHSPNSGSVMFWAIESDVVTTVLGGPPPVEFDSADRADLATIRSGSLRRG